MLHSFAGVYSNAPTEDHKADAQWWMNVFTSLVRFNSRGCKRCLSEWEKIHLIMPPQLDSRAEFYLWTLAAHDRVNRKLGKPLMHPNLTLQHPLLVAS